MTLAPANSRLLDRFHSEYAHPFSPPKSEAQRGGSALLPPMLTKSLLRPLHRGAHPFAILTLA